MSLNQVYPRPIHIGSISYSSGEKRTLDLPRDGVVLEYLLRLQFTCTNGATGPTDPFFQTLARLIRRVDIRLAGKDTVVSMSGEMLAARAQYEMGVPMRGMDDTVVLTNSAATTYDVTIPIPRYLPRSRTPLATADDLRAVKQATIEVTWGTSNAANLFGTPNSAAISAVSLDVQSRFLMNVPAGGFFIRELTEISEIYTATDTKMAVTLDGQTGLNLRSIAVASLVDSVGSNSPLSAGGIAVKAGSEDLMDQKAPMIQGENRMEFQQQSLITGFYYHGFTWGGELSHAINTSPANIPADLKAYFDITKISGTSNLLISLEKVRAPNFGVQ